MLFLEECQVFLLFIVNKLIDNIVTIQHVFIMTQNEFDNISGLLKLHYGATEVFLDGNRLVVYGTEPTATYVAVVVEYGHLYDVEYKTQHNNPLVLELLKKENKGVDKSKTTN